MIISSKQQPQSYKVSQVEWAVHSDTLVWFCLGNLAWPPSTESQPHVCSCDVETCIFSEKEKHPSLQSYSFSTETWNTYVWNSRPKWYSFGVNRFEWTPMGKILFWHAPAASWTELPLVATRVCELHGDCQCLVLGDQSTQSTLTCPHSLRCFTTLANWVSRASALSKTLSFQVSSLVS